MHLVIACVIIAVYFIIYDENDVGDINRPPRSVNQNRQSEMTPVPDTGRSIGETNRSQIMTNRGQDSYRDKNPSNEMKYAAPDGLNTIELEDVSYTDLRYDIGREKLQKVDEEVEEVSQRNNQLSEQHVYQQEVKKEIEPRSNVAGVTIQKQQFRQKSKKQNSIDHEIIEKAKEILRRAKYDENIDNEASEDVKIENIQKVPETKTPIKIPTKNGVLPLNEKLKQNKKYQTAPPKRAELSEEQTEQKASKQQVQVDDISRTKNLDLQVMPSKNSNMLNMLNKLNKDEEVSAQNHQQVKIDAVKKGENEEVNNLDEVDVKIGDIDEGNIQKNSMILSNASQAVGNRILVSSKLGVSKGLTPTRLSNPPQ